MNKKILLTLALSIFFISLASASLESLGDEFNQGDCISIKQTCATCTYANLSFVSYPNSEIALSNVEMESLGNGAWNYTFCDTQYIGRYDVGGKADKDGVETEFTYYFIVKGGNIGFFIILFIVCYGLTFYGLKIQNPWVSLFGCFGLLFLGIYNSFYGIDVYKNNLTAMISYLNIGLGLGIGYQALREITYL